MFWNSIEYYMFHEIAIDNLFHAPATLAVLIISLLVLVVERLPHPVELEKKKIRIALIRIYIL